MNELDEFSDEEYNDEYETSEVISSTNEEDINSIMKNYKKHKKTYKTNPVITKYEKTRVLSERTSQINEGSIVFIPNEELYDNAYDIAVVEYNEKKIPFIIKRTIGNKNEYWKLNDLL
jgi:DNA-directed RNA polymerase I, II, and III subunit RPABC2